MKKTVNSLYIHIPFCNKICSYCDFLKVLYFPKISGKYIDKLVEDISTIKKKFNKFKTIYIGGGTPSILSNEELELLLSSLKPLLRKKYEFTIEANPESIDETKLKIFSKFGINRISIGIQTFNINYLKLINRDYNIDYFKLIQLVKKYIDNINVDFIYGLPNETLKDIEYDLNNFLKLNVNHISLYSLMIESGSKLYLDGYKEENQDNLRNQYDLIVKTLSKYKYNRYEVSNFSLKNKESKHNLTYWHDEEYLALGASSSGYINNIRYKNTSNISSYIKGINNIEKEMVSIKDDKEYFLLTNLRLEKGFLLSKYKERFNEDFYLSKKDIIDQLIKEKIVKLTKYRFKVNKKYIYTLDSILVKLI